MFIPPHSTQSELIGPLCLFYMSLPTSSRLTRDSVPLFENRYFHYLADNFIFFEKVPGILYARAIIMYILHLYLLLIVILGKDYYIYSLVSIYKGSFSVVLLMLAD